MTIDNINNTLDELHLLKHPFYQAWNMGALSSDTLKVYAKEYYHHVAAFPRYLSRIHSNCSDINTRQILLGNLIEEEQGEKNHPELWKNFARRFGVFEEEFNANPQLEETKELVDGYFDLVDKDFAEGIGALYAYERQTPAVAESKIEGLQKFYSVTDEKSLEFFTVHIKADEWHSEECANIIAKLPEDQQIKAQEGAIAGAKLLWKFLDGMMEVHTTSQKQIKN